MLETIEQHHIERCGQALIEAYGAEARLEARCRRDRFLAAGDLEGFVVWWRIERVIAIES